MFWLLQCKRHKISMVGGGQGAKGKEHASRDKCENLEEYWPQHLPAGQSCSKAGPCSVLSGGLFLVLPLWDLAV